MPKRNLDNHRKQKFHLSTRNEIPKMSYRNVLDVTESEMMK